MITGRLQNPLNFEDFCSTMRRRRSSRSLFESSSGSVTNFFSGAFTIARGVSASETAEIILGLGIVLVSTCAGAGVAARAGNLAFVLVWPVRSGQPVLSRSSPIVVNGRLFVYGSYDPNLGASRYLFAIFILGWGLRVLYICKRNIENKKKKTLAV